MIKNKNSFNSFSFRSNYSALVLLLSVITYVYIIFNIGLFRSSAVIKWDAFGYYLYLPATFIYNGLNDLSFVPHLNSDYNAAENVPHYGTIVTEAGDTILKFTGGLSVLLMPFFLIAHAVASVTPHPADGMSQPYQLAVIFAALFYSLVGLYFLRKVLLKYFSDGITAMVLFLIAFATNYYHYVVVESGMSHIYLFALLSMILYFTIEWHEKASLKYAVGLGLCLGMAAWIRPSDILFALVPILWGIKDKDTLQLKLQKFKEKYGHLLLAACLVLLIGSIQLLYWKTATGNWVVYSYKGEGGFDFSDPEIWKGLFSYRKGWFIYTPVMLFAIWGIYFIRNIIPGVQLLLVLFLVLNIYVIFSWNPWWYGGSFGMRAMIESYALLALPLASFISFVQKKGRLIFGLLIIVFIFLTTLNVIQSHQRRTGIMHWEEMNKERYWELFMRVK